MADTDISTPTSEVTSNIPDLVDPFNNVNESVKQSAESVGMFSNNLNFLTNGIESFVNKTSSIFPNLNEMTKLSNEGSLALNLVSTAMLNVADSASKISGVDFENLNTFSNQIKNLLNTVNSEQLAQIGAMFDNKIDFKKAINEKGMGVVKNRIIELASTFTKSADEGLKFQEAMMQMAAKTGNLGNLLKAAGPNFEHMGKLHVQQINTLKELQKSESISEKQSHALYGALSTIPEALDSNIAAATGADKTLNMYSATMRLVTATKRDLKDITDDLSESMSVYGSTNEQAIRFTSRMTEVSQNYNLKIEDIRRGLRNAADAFKLYGASGDAAGRMLEGSVKIMNNYVGALKASGVSGSESINIASQLTRQISELSLEQKAFLSLRSGGPGGLMGAFRIEEMMKQGRVDEVMEKVRETLMKQFGRIASVEEAARSPEAANRLTRQSAFLTQGPFGALAKDTQSSLRLLEALSKIQKGEGIKPLDNRNMQNTLDTGLKLQQRSHTLFNSMAANLEKIAATTSEFALKNMQKTAGIYLPGRVEAVSKETKKNIDRRMMESMESSEALSNSTVSYKNLQGKDLKSISEHQLKYLKDVQNMFPEFVNLGKTMLSNVSKSVETMTGKNPQREYLESQKSFYEDEAKKEKNKDKKQDFINKANKTEEIIKYNISLGNFAPKNQEEKSLNTQFKAMQINEEPKNYYKMSFNPNIGQQNNNSTNEYFSKLSQNNNTVNNAVLSSLTNAIKDMKSAKQSVDVNTNVKLEVVCPDCHKNINVNNAQAMSSSPQSQ